MTNSELTGRNIKNGQLIWYNGSRSMGGWSCPAIIGRVNRKKRTFHVISLDDMREQDQVYFFDVTDDMNTPQSRRTMRLTTPDRVRTYLSERERALETKFRVAKGEMLQRKEALRIFRYGKKRLSLP